MHFQFGETLAIITIGLKSHGCGQSARGIRKSFPTIKRFSDPAAGGNKLGQLMTQKP
jgi:hypothetical protein